MPPTQSRAPFHPKGCVYEEKVDDRSYSATHISGPVLVAFGNVVSAAKAGLNIARLGKANMVRLMRARRP